MKKFLSLMLCAALTLCAFAAYAENAELNIATNQYYALMERMEQFEQESGISITCEKSVDIMDTISTAYVIKNPDIDLFVFTAYDGLYTLKNMKYYAPLTGSAILQDAFQHVYPALRPVCTDDDTLMGWTRVRRPLFKQRRERYRYRSLIYKLPVFRWSGATARYSCFRVPVETGTPPRRHKVCSAPFPPGGESFAGSLAPPHRTGPACAGLRFGWRLRRRARNSYFNPAGHSAPQA